MILSWNVFLAVFGTLTACVVLLPNEYQSGKSYSKEEKTLMHKGYSNWLQYKSKFDKKFENHTIESEHMLTYLKARLQIAEHNKRYSQGKVSWYQTENAFTDNPPRFRALRNVFRSANKTFDATVFHAPVNVNVPSSIDWRQHGYVTKVKNQGKCAACWAFSTTGSIEGQHKRATGKLISLSEQNLIDCDKENDGCKGGGMIQAYMYVWKNHGIDTEKSYSYEGSKGKCRFDSQNVGAKITGYAIIPTGDEYALKVAVATQGPVSVGIDDRSFANYGGGIFYDTNCSTIYLNHSMLVVGYGRESDQDYWILKNSWGTGWGENGYIRIARNRGNLCGIATIATYPLILNTQNQGLGFCLICSVFSVVCVLLYIISKYFQ